MDKAGGVAERERCTHKPTTEIKGAQQLVAWGQFFTLREGEGGSERERERWEGGVKGRIGGKGKGREGWRGREREGEGERERREEGRER